MKRITQSILGVVILIENGFIGLFTSLLQPTLYETQFSDNKTNQNIRARLTVQEGGADNRFGSFGKKHQLYRTPQ